MKSSRFLALLIALLAMGLMAQLGGVASAGHLSGAQTNSTPAPAQVPKTGQTISYAAGDDGDLETGIAWPAPRLTDNGDGTVTDNLTGLMWAKNAFLAGERKTWPDAIDFAENLNHAGYTD